MTAPVVARPLTVSERRLFLRRLAETGVVRDAAARASVGRSRLYLLRTLDEDFAADWDAAVDAAPRHGNRPYPSEAERLAARRESWRRSQARRRQAAASFPSWDNFLVSRRVTCPHMRWWLARRPLDWIVQVGGALDGLAFDHSGPAPSRTLAGRERVGAS